MALSVSFDNVGQDASYKIASLLSVGAPKGAATALTSADQIWLWDTEAGDWVKYFYRKIGNQAAVGWCKAGATTKTTDKIPAGQGFFFRRGGGGTADKITFTFSNSSAE